MKNMEISTYPSITSRKQFFGGGAASSHAWGKGALGPGASTLVSPPSTPAPLRQSQEVPHLSLDSSVDETNWHFRGDLCFPLGDSDDFRGDDGALTGLGEALTGLDDAFTGDGDTFTGDDCSERAPESVVPFSISEHTYLTLFCSYNVLVYDLK